MDQTPEKEQEKPTELHDEPGIGCLGHVVLLFVGLLLALPITIKYYHWFNWVPIDDFFVRTGLVLVIFSLLYYRFIARFRELAILAIIGFVGYMAVNQFRGKGITFEKAWNSYAKIIETSFEKNPNIFYDIEQGMIASVESDILASVDYTNPEVKNYANIAATAHFTENEDQLFYRHGNIIRYFSIFKTINSGWKYVEDPADREYFAKASESMNTLAGDCDDHTALMTACIKAVGGEARMVWVREHIFPVVWVANDKYEFNLRVKPLINELFGDLYMDEYVGVIETEEGLWLNFDYTKKYPGGPFMNKEIVKFINV